MRIVPQEELPVADEIKRRRGAVIDGLVAELRLRFDDATVVHAPNYKFRRARRADEGLSETLVIDGKAISVTVVQSKSGTNRLRVAFSCPSMIEQHDRYGCYHWTRQLAEPKNDYDTIALGEHVISFMARLDELLAEHVARDEFDELAEGLQVQARDHITGPASVTVLHHWYSGCDNDAVIEVTFRALTPDQALALIMVGTNAVAHADRFLDAAKVESEKHGREHN